MVYDNDLKIYENEIKKYKKLTKEEEFDYFKRYKNGEDIKNELIKSYLFLVVIEAKKFYNCLRYTSFSIMDIIEYGNIGLFNAIDKYDFSYNKRFSTFASFLIKKAIFDAIRDYGYMVRIPSYVINRRNKIEKSRDQLRKELLREPTNLELASYLNISYKKLLLYLDRNNMQSIVSTDLVISSTDDEVSLIDYIKDENDYIEDILNIIYKLETKSAIYQFLKNINLSSIQFDIIIKRFGILDGQKKTYKEIANLFGVSSQYIYKQEVKALEKIRNSDEIYNLANYRENPFQSLQNIGKKTDEIINYVKK